MYFLRSTENDPSVQSMTNDVLANNLIRRELNSIHYAQYSFGTRKKMASQISFALIFQEAVYRPSTAIFWFKQVTVNSIIFPTAVKQAQRLPAVSSDLRYCICLVLHRQQSFYIITGFSCFRFQ